MASVYKSVSKKAARQPTEDMSDEDIEMEELLNAEDDTTDSEEEESDDGEPAEVVKKQLASGFMPKTRVLILTSRGASYRYEYCALRVMRTGLLIFEICFL
jgi:ribosome biogenesis protein BRX1